MQIFVTSYDIILCAHALDNIRLNKQIVEAAQLLSNFMWYHNIKNAPYKPAFMNHPITQWSCNPENIHWLFYFFYYCIGEYEWRWDKKIHKCSNYLSLFNNIRPIEWPHIIYYGQFHNGSFFKDLPVVEAYQLTLKAKWQMDKRTPRWTKRNMPFWAC